METRWVELVRPRLTARVLVTGSGSPALFVHGGGGLASTFVPLLAHLRGIEAFAVDRPGCGLSGDFSYRGVDLRGHAVDFLEAVLDALKLDRVPIIANSMGALWSLWLAADRPSRVASLALLGCPALLLGTSAPFGIRLLSVPGLNRLLFAIEPPSRAQARRVLARMGHEPAEADPDGHFSDLMMAARRLPGYVTGFATLLERALHPGGARLPFDEELGKVKCPVLYLWGDRDPFGSVVVGRAAAERTPAAELEVVSGGHLPWLDAPVLCAEHVSKWLTRIAGCENGSNVASK